VSVAFALVTPLYKKVRKILRYTRSERAALEEGRVGRCVQWWSGEKRSREGGGEGGREGGREGERGVPWSG